MGYIFSNQAAIFKTDAGLSAFFSIFKPGTSVRSDGVNRYSAQLFLFVTDNVHLYRTITRAKNHNRPLWKSLYQDTTNPSKYRASG